MNTLYITSTGRIMLDENNIPHPCDYSREGISNIFHIKEDTTVVYERGEVKTTLEAKAGDIVISFYENEFPNKIIIVNSKEWKENLETYEACEQKRKEEWAKKKAEECDKPCACECECSQG